MADTSPYVLALICIAVVALYYLGVRLKVGPGLPKGLIRPHWSVPEDMSPVRANFLAHPTFSSEGYTAFSASIFELAVKGFVVLTDLGTEIVFRRTNKSEDKQLPASQQAILSHIANPGSEFTIDRFNGWAVDTLVKDFRQTLGGEDLGQYHEDHSSYFLFGFILSIVSLGVFVFLTDFNFEQFKILLGVSVVVPFFFILVPLFIWRLMAEVRAGCAAKIFVTGILVFVVYRCRDIALSFPHDVWQDTIDLGLPPIILAIGGIFLTNVASLFLIGGRTPLGRTVLERFEGFSLYLQLSEKERAVMARAPLMSASHFEDMLPYAVALGVEKNWCQQFRNWLISAGVASSYAPSWYGGSPEKCFGDWIVDFSSALAQRVEAVVPEPEKK